MGPGLGAQLCPRTLAWDPPPRSLVRRLRPPHPVLQVAGQDAAQPQGKEKPSVRVHRKPAAGSPRSTPEAESEPAPHGTRGSPARGSLPPHSRGARPSRRRPCSAARATVGKSLGSRGEIRNQSRMWEQLPEKSPGGGTAQGVSRGVDMAKPFSAAGQMVVYKGTLTLSPPGRVSGMSSLQRKTLRWVCLEMTVWVTDSSLQNPDTFQEWEVS